jgi:hypothetical protein
VAIGCVRPGEGVQSGQRRDRRRGRPRERNTPDYERTYMEVAIVMNTVTPREAPDA